MKNLLTPSAFVATLLSAAIFGFFYAWVCSTMWGLDATDPRIAIQAMQAMNASVRNPVFAPIFFATPFALMLVAAMAYKQRFTQVTALFGSAGVLYLFGGLILTASINVPMNNALGLMEIPDQIQEAREIWQAYSGKWQFWNVARTFASGVSVLLAAMGLYYLGQAQSRPVH